MLSMCSICPACLILPNYRLFYDDLQ
jgi:hypothetical protein